MTVRRPSDDDLRRIAQLYNMTVTDEELEVFQGAIDRALRSCDRVDEMVETKLPVKYPRTPGYRPGPEENPYGAWAWKCSIKGAPQGLLSGRRVAFKDVVAVAGMPLLNGTSLMEGYIPEIDAVIVTRVLDAGGEVAGKSMCTGNSLSAGSHTSYPWWVRNPHDPTRMTGGSSAGSAALLAAGELDMAIGGDQGGSIRIPASWCGVVGMKPTFGLVPYTGIMCNEWTVDHVGPMGRTVYDTALLLEAIAGPDGLDPRQWGMPEALPSYSTALQESIRGLRIGVVKESFGWPDLSEPDVDEKVRGTVSVFKELGAEVREVSIPIHLDGQHIWRGMRLEGSWVVLAQDPGSGHGWFNYYDTHLVDFYGRARRARANDLAPEVKLYFFQGHYLADRYQGHYYAKAQNLRRNLRDAYDAVLSEVDILLMPTVPIKAIPLPEDPTLADYMKPGGAVLPNTAPFNMTGHPSISVPCGTSEGLPVGLMLTGRMWEDDVVLRAAHAYEQGA